MPRTGVSSRALPPGELLLAEYLILGLTAEAPTHGFALARLVAPDGPVGRVFQVSRPIVYRSIDRLVAAELVEPEGVERSQQGPRRTVIRINATGRRELRAWFKRPVGHVRDLRTELLAKLTLLARSGGDPRPLLAAQRRALLPIVEGLAEERKQARGLDRTILDWRYQSVKAAMRFLDDAERAAAAG